MPPTLTDLLARPLALDLLDHPGHGQGAPETGTDTTPLTRESLGCSEVAWQSLLRDGALVELRDGWALVAGTGETAAHRAGTLVPVVPAGVVVARSWAAWVHTGGPPPPETPRRVCVLYPRGDSRPRTTPGLEPVRATLRPWDVDSVAALRLTSAVRTAMDVASWASEPEAGQVLGRLFTSGVEPQDVLLQLDRVTGWRGADRARLAVAAAARQACTTGSAAFDPVIR